MAAKIVAWCILRIDFSHPCIHVAVVSNGSDPNDLYVPRILASFLVRAVVDRSGTFSGSQLADLGQCNGSHR